MASFAFTRLPVELQLMVWEYARASIEPQAITGELDLSTTPLSVRGQNVARVKEYIRLFSICHNSRQEVLRNPPVLILESPDCRRLDYPDPAYDAKPLTIKHWHFGRVFTDIAFDLCLLEWVPEPAGDSEREQKPRTTKPPRLGAQSPPRSLRHHNPTSPRLRRRHMVSNVDHAAPPPIDNVLRLKCHSLHNSRDGQQAVGRGCPTGYV